jgi:hypothetical protein
MSSLVHDKLDVPVSYVVSNPSSYAWPDSTRPTAAAYSVQAHAPGYIPALEPLADPFRAFSGARDCTTFDQWPYGLKDRTGYTAKQTDAQLKQQLISRPTTYLLGELDVLPLGGFDGSCPAMAQGPKRLARGEAFGKFVNEKLGAHHIVVSECGHNARCMFTSEDALPSSSSISSNVARSGILPLGGTTILSLSIAPPGLPKLARPGGVCPEDSAATRKRHHLRHSHGFGNFLGLCFPHPCGRETPARHWVKLAELAGGVRD